MDMDFDKMLDNQEMAKRRRLEDSTGTTLFTLVPETLRA